MMKEHDQNEKVKQNEVPTALQGVERAAVALSEAMDEICVCLQPYITPKAYITPKEEPEKVSGDEMDYKYSCPRAREIEELEVRIAGQVSRLQDLVNRLEA